MPLTPVYEMKAVRYADGEFDERFNRVIIVREGKQVSFCLHFRLLTDP